MCAVYSPTGAQCLRMLSPEVLVMVTIILRDDEKGIWYVCGCAFSSASLVMPIFWPATMSGASATMSASEELPLGTHLVLPFSSGSCASLVSD